VALLAPVGIDATDATLASLIGQTAFILATLPGAFVPLRRQDPARSGAQEPNPASRKRSVRRA